MDARGPDGRPSRMAGSLTDIRDRKEMERQLRHLAVHDALTDLTNRTVLLDRVPRALRRAAWQRSTTLVLHLGVDRFRTISESFGHAVAEELLVRLAERMREPVSDYGWSTASPRGPSLTLTAKL
jgi:GGDEF domain-containing protein